MEFERVREIIAEHLGISADDVAMDMRFREDLNADSLDLMEIVMDIEGELDATISDEDLEGIVTVKDAFEAIQKI